MGDNHPSIWIGLFIDALKTEQNLNEMKIEQYMSGQLPNAPPRIYKEAAEKIKIVFADYAICTLCDYLRGIAHNLSLQVQVQCFRFYCLRYDTRFLKID